MEQNEIEINQPNKRFKSLITGRILSCVPLIGILGLLMVIVLLWIGSIFNESSQISQISNKVSLVLFGAFIFISTILSFICCLMGLVFLIYARKKGAKKTVPFIVVCVGGVIVSILFSMFFFILIKGFESTVGQLRKLSKISEIEEFVLTDDSEEGGFHDGTMYNDLDLYLIHDRFIQVSRMSEYMTAFDVNAVGDWNLYVVYDGDNGKVKQSHLEQKDLSELCGKKIKKLTDFISCYDTFLEKVEKMPLLENTPAESGFYKEPLKKEKLAYRENTIYEDLLHQPGVVSVNKIQGYYDYHENYWYEITMDDNHTLLMTVSAVFPLDDENIKCYFYIRRFDGELISLKTMTNTTYGINYYGPFSSRAFEKTIGVSMCSYRDFFPHYKDFLEMTDELLEESRASKNDKNRSTSQGMLSGTYRPQ